MMLLPDKHHLRMASLCGVNSDQISGIDLVQRYEKD